MSLRRESHERIERAIDGLLSPEELEALKREVVENSELRAAYVDRVWLDASLRAGSESVCELAKADPSPAPTAARWPLLAALTSLAAAGVALVIALQRPSSPLTSADISVATVLQTQNAKWAGSTLPTIEDAQLGRGTLALVEGIVTLRFHSGATVTMEAPTKLEILDAMRCRLIEGSVTADVPPSAHGFTIDTADLKVVDLGTRFGVTAGSAGNSHVFVFEGEVTLNKPNGTEVRHLTEGKAYHVASGATAGSVEPSRFQILQQLDGWTAIPISFGRGRDTYARRDRSASAGLQPLLMVKHSDLEASFGNERRVVLTFDVSGIRPQDSTEVQLVLDPEPSGMGFSSMVPDSRFAIYGVAEEAAADEWDESKLTWNLLPACNDTGVIDGQARKLAEFWIPRGGSGDPLTIRSDALTQFLREDRNGLVTFLIVRETGETHQSGLVHAFASKEHPTGRPPTLRVR